MGITLANRFEWLENLDSPTTRAWVAGQNERARQYLEAIPARSRIADRLAEWFGLDRAGQPPEPRQLLVGTAPSPDQCWMAYGLAESGSDREVWRIRDTQTGQDRADTLSGVTAGGVAWHRDSQGVFYNAARVGGGFALYFHRLGDAQTADRVVYTRPDLPGSLFLPELSQDGRFLVVTLVQGTSIDNGLLIWDFQEPEKGFIDLVEPQTGSYAWVGNQGQRCWLRMEDPQTPLGCLVEVDLCYPERHAWKVCVGQKDVPLVDALVLDEWFVAHYYRQACSELKLIQRDGAQTIQVVLPGNGTVSLLTTESQGNAFSYDFSSYLIPPRRYIYHLDEQASQAVGAAVSQTALPDFQPWETNWFSCASPDGTPVLLSLIHRRGLVRNGSNPTYLTGYGGFNLPVTPTYRPEIFPWLEMGGIYAVAHPRGGGEGGRNWHQAGVGRNKQKTIEDTLSAAEWLLKNGYTRPEKLAIGGESNGGLIAAACLTQRPELFGSALIVAAPLDMLRFDQLGIGRIWVSEYGSPQNEAERAVLLNYSPLHQLKHGVAYPAVLLLTASNDDRVHPSHSYKFAAALQEIQGDRMPTLQRTRHWAGHSTYNAQQMVAYWADCWSFLVQQQKGDGRCASSLGTDEDWSLNW